MVFLAIHLTKKLIWKDFWNTYSPAVGSFLMAWIFPFGHFMWVKNCIFATKKLF